MNKLILTVMCAGACAMVAGCGTVTDVTKDRVARSETVVQQSQQTVANAEAGAIEMQRAKELIEAAQRELNEKKNGKEAERFAMQAQLTAELAVAKTQSAQARKAADELLASLETLRQEAARGGPTTTP